MRTQERLSAAFAAAHVVDFDADSKIVLISDEHRGDGSGGDDFTKNKVVVTHALAHYLAEGFTLIEVGDVEELWEFPNVKHIVRAHGIVYSKLREFHAAGRYYRLFGNHDRQYEDPRYVARNLSTSSSPTSGALEPLLPELTVHEAVRLRETSTGQEVLVLHGHQGDFANDQNWRFTMWTYRLLWKWLHAFGVTHPSSPIRNSYKRHKVERNYVKWIRENKTALICGHTHRAKFPAPDETPYFNTGSTTFNAYITCIEITSGHIALVRWRIESDPAGYLKVTRWVLGGPTPLEAYDRTRTAGLTPAQEAKRHREVRADFKRVSVWRDWLRNGRDRSGSLAGD